MSLTLTYDSTLSRVRASATGLVDGGPATRFGAHLNQQDMGVTDFASAAASWSAVTGIPLSATRHFAGTNYTITTDIAQKIAAGLQICLDLAPPHNPVSSTHRTDIIAFMVALRAAGADVQVSLLHEPFFGGLTSAQYVAAIQFYGPAIRQYYPLWAVFSGNDTIEGNGYFPGAAWVDGIAADDYATGISDLTNCAAMADAHGLPLGLWEYNSAFDLGIDPSPVTGVTNAQATTFFGQVKDFFVARLAAGKPNGNIVFFAGKGQTTGTTNFLGSALTQAGGFEGGIADWGAGNNTSVAHSTAQAHSGAGSLAMTCTVAGTISARHCSDGQITTRGLPVVAGQTVAMSLWVRPNSTTRNVQPGAVFFTAAGAFISALFVSSVAEDAGGWKFFSGTVVAPASSGFVRLNPQINGCAVGEVHYVDDPQIGVLPTSIDHTAPIQYPWDFRIAALSSIRTALGGTGGMTGGHRLERSTDQIRWTTVRGAVSVPASGGVLAVDDYEFAADMTNYYRLVHAGSGITVPDGTADITPDLSGKVWLKSVARPFLNRPVRIRDQSPATRPNRSGRFPIVGRSLPIGVTDVRGSKQYTLEAYAHDAAEARAIDLLLASGDILFIHTPSTGRLSRVPGGYVDVGDATEEILDSADYDLGYFSLPCMVVAAPSPDVVGVTYTWQGVVNDYATWADLVAAFATWADVVDNVGSAEDVVVE